MKRTHDNESFELFHPRDTLADEQVRIRQVMWDTAKQHHCAACGQVVKVYHRTIFARMARELIALVRLYREDERWYHKQEIGAQADGTLAKLVYWGLVEAQPNTDDPTKLHSGYWRPTQLGISFATGKTTVPRTAYTYNDTVLRWSEDRCGIRDCLPEDFDIRDLLGER